MTVGGRATHTRKEAAEGGGDPAPGVRGRILMPRRKQLPRLLVDGSGELRTRTRSCTLVHAHAHALALAHTHIRTRPFACPQHLTHTHTHTRTHAHVRAHTPLTPTKVLDGGEISSPHLDYPNLDFKSFRENQLYALRPYVVSCHITFIPSVVCFVLFWFLTIGW